MAQVINTNVLSLNAQRNLTTSQSSLATALQRLSSGLRINSAKDDAAGLAISDRFTTQIRGLEPSRPQRERRYLARADQRKRARRAHEQPAANPRDRGAGCERFEQRLGPRRSGPRSPTAFGGSGAYRDADRVQRPESVERHVRQRHVPGRRERRRDDHGRACRRRCARRPSARPPTTSTAARRTTARSPSVSRARVSSTPARSRAATSRSRSVARPPSASWPRSTTARARATRAVRPAARIRRCRRSTLRRSRTSRPRRIRRVVFDFVAITDTASAYTMSINGQGIYTADGNAITGTQMAAQINANAAATGVTASLRQRHEPHDVERHGRPDDHDEPDR